MGPSLCWGDGVQGVALGLSGRVIREQCAKAPPPLAPHLHTANSRPKNDR